MAKKRKTAAKRASKKPAKKSAKKSAVKSGGSETTMNALFIAALIILALLGAYFFMPKAKAEPVALMVSPPLVAIEKS